MPYVDYAYYSEVYGGTMLEEDFQRFSRQAAVYIDAATLNRASKAISTKSRQASKVKDACCAVAEAYFANEQGGGIASVDNDGYKETYIAGISKAKTDNERLYEAAVLHLGMTGLMYRG